MKRTSLLCTVLLTAASLQAQSVESFQEFRKGILNDYQEFRKTILDHYADFLEGTWHEYEPLAPAKKDQTPKPVKLPKVGLDKPSTRPVEIPKPKLAEVPDAVKPATPKLGDRSSDGKLKTNADDPSGAHMPPSPFAPPKCVIPHEAKKEVPLTLGVSPKLGSPTLGDIPRLPVKLQEETEVPTTVEEVAEESREGKDVVNFYGMEMLVPHVDFKVTDRLEKVADLARHWKTLDQQDVAKKLVPVLETKFKEWGLNDYLAMEFIQAYFDSQFPNASLASKMSAVHYVLSHLGYNARISITSKTGEPIILVPTEQMLYGVNYLKLDGQSYYILGNRNVNVFGQTLATCDLPKVVENGKKFDMRLNGLNLPRKNHKFDINYKDMHLTGNVNQNLMPVVYRYPQMDTKDYAISFLDRELRDDLIAQLKSQLNGKDPLQATNQLLQFVQYGFSYATDDDFHGFEKPYFLEENLFYPKNDCEDRAIFYTYMLWNVLGLENQLLAFPGHEAASVALPESYNIKGSSYTFDGKRFYISDPTYEGSRTGDCMRQFETTAPTIDHTYK